MQVKYSGKLVSPVSQSYIDNVNPATVCISQIPDSDGARYTVGVSSSWGCLSRMDNYFGDERSAIICAFRCIEKSLMLAEPDGWQPFGWLAKDDFRELLLILDFMPAILHYASGVMSDKAINYTHRDPIGVVGYVSPLICRYISFWKIRLQLLKLCLKPSEITPMTTLPSKYLSKLVFPKVFRILYMDMVVQLVMQWSSSWH